MTKSTSRSGIATFMDEFYSFPLRDDRKVLAAMQSIEQNVYEVVGTGVMRDSWTTIACRMVGFRYREKRAVPTVVVYCRPRGKRDCSRAGLGQISGGGAPS